MNVFQNVTSNSLGFTPTDILNVTFSIVQILVPILLISLAFIFVPKLIDAIKSAAGNRKEKSDDID